MARFVARLTLTLLVSLSMGWGTAGDVLVEALRGETEHHCHCPLTEHHCTCPVCAGLVEARDEHDTPASSLEQGPCGEPRVKPHLAAAVQAYLATGPSLPAPATTARNDVHRPPSMGPHGAPAAPEPPPPRLRAIG